MTLLHRRILTILFLIGFFVVTPLLVYYTSGYRYNFELMRIERTGLLHVTTDPQHSKLILNGQPHNISNELVLKGLKPAKYEIIVIKDNYHSWFKTLEIKPGESTFIRDLSLFYDDVPTPSEIFTTPLTFIKKNQERAVLQSGNFIFIYHFDGQPTQEIELPSASRIADVTIDSEQIILSQDSGWFIINYSQDSLENFSDQLPEKTHRVTSNNNTAYALTDSSIWKVPISADDSTPELVYKQTLPQDIRFSGDSLWIVATEPSNQRSFLYHVASPSSRPRLITSLPFAKSYRIFDDFNGFLTIHDSSENNLYLIDTSTQTATVATLNNVHSWEWSKDHTQLLTTTDFEITIHHVQNGHHQELLRRISTPISAITWHPNEQHVFFVNNDNLLLVERDDRNERNVYLLAEDKKDLHILYVDPSGEKIIFSSMIGNAGGAIWELRLKE